MAASLGPTLNVLSLCSGVGMLDEGLHAGLDFLGIRSRVLAYVERESYAAATLLARMEEQSLEPAPVWCGDLELLDCSLFVGRVDCVVAGFPCQPWSVAGAKAGLDDARWIWPAIMAIVRAVGSPLVLLENVPGLVSGGGLDPVLGALAEARFDAEWLSLAAADVRASHRRERVFILAVDQERGRGILRQSSGSDGLADGCDQYVGDANGGRGEGPSLHARRHAQDRRYAAGTDGSGEHLADASGGRCSGSDRGQGEQSRRAEVERRIDAVVDTDGARHERGEPAGDHREKAGSGPWRPESQRRRHELADAERSGRRERGWPEPIEPRQCGDGPILGMADTGRPSDQRRGGAGIVLLAAGAPEGERASTATAWACRWRWPRRRGRHRWLEISEGGGSA